MAIIDYVFSRFFSAFVVIRNDGRKINLFCKAVDEFPDTWENEFAVVRVRTDQLKGYYQRICEVVVNVTNPLDVRGEWSDIANHTGWIGHVL